MVQFEAYERAVKPLIEAHGGAFARVFRPSLTIGMEDAPDEVHVLTFGRESDLQNYLQTPKPPELDTLRESVKQTIVIGGNEIDYLGTNAIG